MADSEDEGAPPDSWEEGPTTLEAAADYARHAREHVKAFEDTGEPHHLAEARRLLEVLEGYLDMRTREAE
ncbi:hypothetical protein [Arhodomonas sp. AD133]|uniref:hypothetical protein n=1 Tax=Arhodomonas sp. AD133 TaxID=3415009 RepID=UPI003EB77171